MKGLLKSDKRTASMKREIELLRQQEFDETLGAGEFSKTKDTINASSFLSVPRFEGSTLVDRMTTREESNTFDPCNFVPFR